MRSLVEEVQIPILQQSGRRGLDHRLDLIDLVIHFVIHFGINVRRRLDRGLGFDARRVDLQGDVRHHVGADVLQLFHDFLRARLLLRGARRLRGRPRPGSFLAGCRVFLFTNCHTFGPYRRGSR
jgi:hypothetical protein